MFDAVRNNKKIVQVFLALITLPFALWGVDSYVRNASGENEVATVGDAKITVPEFHAELRDQQDRARQQFGNRFDPALLDTPAMRRAVLDSLVSRRLLGLEAKQAKMTVSDADLAAFIAAVPALQENGRFSPERYAAVVAAQGMSKEAFEYRLRQDLSMQQLSLPIGEASIAGRAPALRWAMAQLEQRDVAEVKWLPEAYAAKLAISDEEIAKFYEGNKKLFETPEQVRVEFLALSQAAMQAQVKIGDADIKARYDSRADSYKDPETRRASHILLRLGKEAAEAEVKTATATAEDIVARLKKNPADFAALAKQHSQDPGSAQRGGDLDWFGRGMMVKPFEDTVFSLKEGETSGLVRSDFGIHIIRVTGIRPERVKALADVRTEIAAELQREQAARKFAEAAESFGNLVYEQADSLKPAADKWQLTLRQSEWLVRGAKMPAPFDNAKLSAALFSDDAVKHKRNTEAVEVGNSTLVSARVIEHKPAAVQSLESVREAIKKRLAVVEAAKLAVKDGEEALAKLKKGEELKLAFGATRPLLRSAPVGLPAEAAKAVFAADAGKLPAYAGVALPGGAYAVYRISGVKAAAEGDARANGLIQQYQRMVAEAEFIAWMNGLKQRYPVSIHTARLESK